MVSQGDEILRDELDTAISLNSRPVTDGMCAAHDGLRTGVLVLLKCKRAEMRSPAWAIQASGWGTMTLGLLYAILKAHGVVP